MMVTEKKIMFNDECKILTREYVRRPEWENNNARYTAKTGRFGGGRVLVWDCIKRESRTKLVKLDGNLNGENCIGFLPWNLLPDNEDRKIFRHERAPWHESHPQGWRC